MTSRSELLARRWRWAATALGIAALVVLPQVMPNDYDIHLTVLVVVNSVLAMTFVLLLRAGMISLSIAGFWGIGAYATALLTLKTTMSFWLALPLALLVAAAIATALGALICRYSGLGFIIPSLLFGLIVPLVFGTFEFFGGRVGLIGVFPASTITLPGGSAIMFITETSQYYLVLVFAAAAVVVLLAFYAARTGRTWRAVGFSSKLAESVGINPFRARLQAFVLGSTIAALMGSFFAQYQSNIDPGGYGPFKTITIHVIAILGGVGFPIVGPVLGSVLLTFVPELLRPTGNWEPIITGVLIILIVMYLPHGILGYVMPRLRRRRDDGTGAPAGEAPPPERSSVPSAEASP